MAPRVLESEAVLTLGKQGDEDGSVVVRSEVILAEERVQHDGDTVLPVFVVQQPESLGQLYDGGRQRERGGELDQGVHVTEAEVPQRAVLGVVFISDVKM